jgi:uncharacterized protein (TIGR00725 family)
VVSEQRYIAVVGAGDCESAVALVAEEVGHHLARSGAVLICGGLGGVMEAACRGARAENGLTVGVLPGSDRSRANPYVEVAIATGIGEARNAIIVRTADAVIAIAGEYGTLSEIALALKMGKPVIGLQTWELVKQGRRWDTIHRAKSAEEAVRMALAPPLGPPA